MNRDPRCSNCSRRHDHTDTCPTALTLLDKAVIAAIWIACGYATLVGLVVADRVATPILQARARHRTDLNEIYPTPTEGDPA